MIPAEVREVAQKIGQFYLGRNNNDYEVTAKVIDSLRISEIRVTKELSSKADGTHVDKVTIVTARPGILIGKRGTVIDALEKFLAPMKVHIIEDADPLFEHLIPRKEDDDWLGDYVDHIADDTI